MHSSNHFDSSSLFSGGGFMPSQSAQPPDPPFSPAKSHGPQCVIPLTVKQIAQSYLSGDDKPNLTVYGVEANFRILGLVVNMVERVTDMSFLLDDGTGQIEISRWMSVASDAHEVAAVRDGMYVQVNGHMKEFQGKRHAFAFSVRAVSDFNEIALHFIECIYVHLENTRLKGGVPTHVQANRIRSIPFANEVKGYQAPISNQFLVHRGTDPSGNDVYNLVLAVFQEPAVLASEHGFHVDGVVRRLGLPKNKIMEAISYLVDVGQIYSTIDEYHFKSAGNG